MKRVSFFFYYVHHRSFFLLFCFFFNRSRSTFFPFCLCLSCTISPKHLHQHIHSCTDFVSLPPQGPQKEIRAWPIEQFFTQCGIWVAQSLRPLGTEKRKKVISIIVSPRFSFQKMGFKSVAVSQSLKFWTFCKVKNIFSGIIVAISGDYYSGTL